MQAYHWANSKRTYLVELNTYSAVKTEIGQTNLLRIVTRGNQVTDNVNGKGLATFKADPPAGGGRIGGRASSPPDARANSVVSFSDLKITK